MIGIFTAIEQTIAIWISDGIHVENPYDAEKLRSYRDKTVLIPPGIENYFLTAMPSPKTKQIIERKIKRQKEEKIVLFLGRVHKAKGVNHAMFAVNALRAAEHKVKLVVAGPSANFFKGTKKFANAFKSNGFIYVGEGSEKEKMALIDLADVILIPSLSDVVEAYSIVASEAWARGKLVVAYAVGALKYRIKNGINGYLAQEINYKELARKIAMALSHSKNFELPSDVWTWDKVANRCMQVYFSLKSIRTNEM